jgi:hypothetical protein
LTKSNNVGDEPILEHVRMIHGILHEVHTSLRVVKKIDVQDHSSYKATHNYYQNIFKAAYIRRGVTDDLIQNQKAKYKLAKKAHQSVLENHYAL